MDNWPERALHTLKIYYERGVQAFNELQEGKLDEADLTLGRRNAAFHNFRAADYLAREQGYPEVVWEKMKIVWNDLEVLDQKLVLAMTDAKLSLENQLSQIAKVRSTLKRYKAGDSEINRFEKSV